MLTWAKPTSNSVASECGRYTVPYARIGDLHAYTLWRGSTRLHTETNLTTADRPAALARCKAAAEGDAT